MSPKPQQELVGQLLTACQLGQKSALGWGRGSMKEKAFEP